jgi:hypothetical protein
MNDFAGTLNTVEAPLGNAAGKNKIINGDFNIWQRGTSFSNPASGDLFADRYRIQYDGSGATRTLSQQTFTPGAAPVAGYEGTFFFRYARTVAGSAATFDTIRQRVEDVRVFAGQTVTLSFWAKVDSGTPTLSLRLGQIFVSVSPSVFTSDVNVTLSSTWTRYTATFSLPSISGKTIGAGSYLQVDFRLPVNTILTTDFWGVQLEAGSIATPFQTATGTIQGELAACQRYYQKSYDIATAPGALTSSGANVGKTASNTVANLEQYGTSYLKVSMRAAPTVTIYGRLGGTAVVSNPSTGADLAANSGTATFINENSFMIFNNSGGTVTTERFSVMYHYVASAEL